MVHCALVALCLRFFALFWRFQPSETKMPLCALRTWNLGRATEYSKDWRDWRKLKEVKGLSACNMSTTKKPGTALQRTGPLCSSKVEVLSNDGCCTNTWIQQEGQHPSMGPPSLDSETIPKRFGMGLSQPKTASLERAFSLQRAWLRHFPVLSDIASWKWFLGWYIRIRIMKIWEIKGIALFWPQNGPKNLKKGTLKIATNQRIARRPWLLRETRSRFERRCSLKRFLPRRRYHLSLAMDRYSNGDPGPLCQFIYIYIYAEFRVVFTVVFSIRVCFGSGPRSWAKPWSAIML